MKIYNIINIPKGLSPEFECDCQDEYNSGYTQGVEDQKSKLSSISISGNGEYVSEDGFSAVTVNVEGGGDNLQPLNITYMANGFFDINADDGYDGFMSPIRVVVDVPQTGHTDQEMEEAFESGVTSGITEQKSRLSGVTITENGTYTRADGFSAVTVDVPQEEIHLEPLGAVFSANGNYDIRVRSGYDGFESPANIYVDVPQTGHTDQEMEDSWNSGYTSGQTDAWQPAYDSGYTDGAASVDCQPLYDSGYTDGYSSGRTDGYDDGWRPGYNSGYTDGINAAGGDYASGYTDGFESGYDSGVTDGYASGYTSGKTDGYDEGYDEGHDMGYDEGWADGFEDGYTSGGTDAWQPAYNSGYTDGAASVDCQPLYDSGYTAGYESGHTDGYDERAAMLTAMTITANGAYESVEGWSAVTVNVSGYSQQDLDNAYASGHTSGVTDGAAQQKALLSATAITQNGTYTRENGWSAVTVNVPQTGYTQQDLDNAFNSGLTNGYNSGWTAGYDSGYTDGLDACGGQSGVTKVGIIYRTDDTNVSFRPTSAVTLFNEDILSAVTRMVVDGNEVTPTSVYDFTGDIGHGSIRYHAVEYYFNSTTVPDFAFHRVTHIVDATISGDCTDIGSGAFWLCSMMGCDDWNGYPGVTLSPDINLTNANVFAYCTNLKTFEVPTAATVIPSGLCYVCSGLTSLTIHSGVTEIGDIAFQQATRLTTLTLPASLTKMGRQAFYLCTGLTSVTLLSDTPPEIYTGADSPFAQTTCVFYVPAGSVEAYKTDTGWSVYANRIQAIQ